MSETETETETVTAAMKGLRAVEEQQDALVVLGLFLEDHPTLNFSWIGSTTLYIGIPYVTDEDGVIDYEQIDTAGVAEQVRLMKDGGAVAKRSTDDYMTYTRTFEGSRAKLEMSVPRKAVCERVVTGTEQVVVQPVPYQPGRTEVREVVEWKCAPILAQAEGEDVTDG